MNRTTFAGALCLAAAASAAGAGEFSVEGKGMGKSMMTPHQVAEDHMLMELHTEYSDFRIADADNPMHGMSGPCFGAVEMKAGVVSGGGKCLYTDGSGDNVTMEWRAHALGEDGAMHGTWNVTGGTGKWSDASGGGRFSSLTDQSTGENVNSVLGTVVLP